MSDDHVYLCGKGCPACGAPCERKLDHDDQCKCINCGCRWYGGEEYDDE
jgi:hypothetical protein